MGILRRISRQTRSPSGHPAEGEVMKRALIAAAAVLSLSGCASIMEGSSTQEIKFSSVPEGAAVTVFTRTGEVAHTGRTPTVLALDRSGGFLESEIYTVLIRKKGYEPQEITLESIPNGWWVGNVVFGGLIGMLVVDPYTGAMFKLEPTEDTKKIPGFKYDAPLPAQSRNTLTVILKEQVPSGMQSQLQPIK
jgi:uncharacterized protein YceK